MCQLRGHLWGITGHIYDYGFSDAPATLHYDEWGNLDQRTDFAGQTTSFGYDVLNRLKSKSADPTHPSLSGGSAIARIEYWKSERATHPARR